MYKQILIFVLGAGLGGLLGYKYAEKKMAELNEKDIAELKAYYNNEYMGKLLKNNEQMNEIADKISELDEQIGSENAENGIDNSDNSNENAEWNEKVEEIKEKAVKKTKKSTKKAKNEPVEPPTESRLIISAEEFLEENDFDKETMYYYEEDEIFCTPEYEIVHEGIDLIGKENLDNVGMFEDGVLYVRNELYGKDFEIIFYEGAYSDIVEGED